MPAGVAECVRGIVLGVRCAIMLYYPTATARPQEYDIGFHTGQKIELNRSMGLRRIGLKDSSSLALRVCYSYIRDADNERNPSILRSLVQNTMHLPLKPGLIPNFTLPIVVVYDAH